MTTNTEAMTRGPNLSAAYNTKAASYFDGARDDFIARLPRDPGASILEVGCGTGSTGALAFKHQRAGRYVGIELMEEAGKKARDVLTDVIVGDVESMEFDWRPAQFDAFIMSEVLEHLVDPEGLLNKLSRFIRPGGIVLASSPNISHWRALRELALGHFPATEKGVFDRTHLRWFTPETFAAMFERTGYKVHEVRPVTPFSERVKLISKLTGGRYEYLFMTQIAITATRR